MIFTAAVAVIEDCTTPVTLHAARHEYCPMALEAFDE